MNTLAQLSLKAPTRNCWLAFWGCSGLVLAVDQITKVLALSALAGRPPVEVIPGFFQLTLTFNPGAAFSLLVGQRWLFVGVAGLALVFLPVYHRSLLRDGLCSLLASSSLGSILGGALGNAYDRLFRPQGLVVDFLHFYWQVPGPGRSFPVFNWADTCISCGLVLLLTSILWQHVRQRIAGSVEASGVPDSDSDW